MEAHTVVESWHVKWIKLTSMHSQSLGRDNTHQIWGSVMLNCGEDAKLSTKETQSWEKEKFRLRGWESGEGWNHGGHHRLQDVRTGHYRIHRSLLKEKKKKKEQFSQRGSKKWTALMKAGRHKNTQCV